MKFSIQFFKQISFDSFFFDHDARRPNCPAPALGGTTAAADQPTAHAAAICPAASPGATLSSLFITLQPH